MNWKAKAFAVAAPCAVLASAFVAGCCGVGFPGLKCVRVRAVDDAGNPVPYACVECAFPEPAVYSAMSFGSRPRQMRTRWKLADGDGAAWFFDWGTGSESSEAGALGNWTVDDPMGPGRLADTYFAPTNRQYGGWLQTPFLHWPVVRTATVTYRRRPHPKTRLWRGLRRPDKPIQPGEPALIDVLAGKWLPPYGDGAVADAEFEASEDGKTAELRFLREGDGISPARPDRPAAAPETGYARSLEIAELAAGERTSRPRRPGSRGSRGPRASSTARSGKGPISSCPTAAETETASGWCSSAAAVRTRSS